MKKPAPGQILGVTFLIALLLLIVPTAFAGDQDQVRNRDLGEIPPDHDQDPDRDRIRGDFLVVLLNGDRLRDRDRDQLRDCDPSGLLVNQSASRYNLSHQWRYNYQNMLNGSVPPGFQGIALLPLWYVWR